MILAVKTDRSEVRIYDDNQYDEAAAFIVRDGYLIEGVAQVSFEGER